MVSATHMQGYQTADYQKINVIFYEVTDLWQLKLVENWNKTET